MNLFRKTIFWLHLVAGVVAGVVILIMSVTGVLLAYEKQIIAWAERDRHVTPLADASRLPIESLLSTARTAAGTNAPTAVTFRAAPHLPALVSFGREKTLLVNPYTGELLGEGSKKTRAFMRTMIDWHRWLGMQGEQRPIGKGITGVCNLAFLFLVLSGFYLWFPRQLSGKAFRAVLWFGRGLTGKARDWNWHNVLGVWSAVPLFFVVSTAVFFSYQWSTPLLYRVMGEEPPPARPAPPAATGNPRNARNDRPGPREVNLDGLNDLVASAQTHMPDWKTMTVRLGPSVVFIMDCGNGAQPNRKLQLTFSQGTGELSGKETYGSYSPAKKVRLWVRWIHTGEAFGWFGQALAMLASAGGTMLVWTGISLALRRFFGRSAKST